MSVMLLCQLCCYANYAVMLVMQVMYIMQVIQVMQVMAAFKAPASLEHNAFLLILQVHKSVDESLYAGDGNRGLIILCLESK